MPERATRWLNRVAFGRSGLPAMGFSRALWKWDPNLYESAPAISGVLSALGKPADNDAVCYEATRSLLFDVVDAASGVETALQEVTSGVDQAQAEWDKSAPDPDQDGGIYSASTEYAWHSVENLVTWARTLNDRLRRPARMKGYPDQGFIMALAHGPLREAVIAARAKMLSSPFGEARFLAGLNLHMQPMQPGSQTASVENGRVRLRFPDAVNGPIDHRCQLTYSGGRDALTWAEAVFVATEGFMEEMLAALANPSEP